MTSMKSVMRRRKSVRTFDGQPLSPADREYLRTISTAATNPFDVSVTFRLLDAKTHGLSSPVIVGADTYLAAKAARVPNYEIAFGYSFEKACLLALSRGIGTVMLAASLSRGAFERAMEVHADEVMPVASPVGYAAEKRSIRESLMRKGIRADDRLPFGELFFEGGFDRPLGAQGAFSEALELMRWAPSAANKQPWRAVVDGDSVHFYEAKSMKDSPLGDIQLVDVGIGLAHFHLALREDGVEGTFSAADPGIPVPNGIRYVISFRKA